jgi:transcriptional regulator GlxA family with amidase domain
VFAAAVRRAAGRARRTVSICTGSFILAAAGLLDGRRAATHWTMTEELARQYPTVEVDPDRIFVQDGDVWTSAGVTSGFDLMLSLVESDMGPEAARTIAQVLVLYLRRTGSQTQFSTQLAMPLPRREPMRELQQYILANPAADLSLTALAERMNMSQRHFARVFTAEFGLSPGRYVEKVRLETARRLLESDCRDLAAAARAAGYGNQQAMRRAFTTTLGVSPTEYRRRFGEAPAELHVAV